MPLSILLRLNLLALLLLFATDAAYAGPVSPDNLKAPNEITCVYLAEPLEVTALYGMFNVQWTTRLERGPYWSEKVDDKGTYYRAPIGGVSVIGKDGKGFPGQPITVDGGFYIPNNESDSISLYKHFSTEAVPPQSMPGNEDCTTLAYVVDPMTSKIDLVSFSAAGAAGGATGGMIGRGMASNSTMSYGHAVGVGTAGGLIAGVIIGSIINTDVGKIMPVQPYVKDAQFIAKLKVIASSKVSLRSGSAK